MSPGKRRDDDKTMAVKKKKKIGEQQHEIEKGKMQSIFEKKMVKLTKKRALERERVAGSTECH